MIFMSTRIHLGGTLFLCLAATGLLMGCQTQGEEKPVVTSGPSAESSTPQIAKRVYEKYVGPKKRIAVSKFDAKGDFVSHYGGYDIGGGLAAQLTTELVKTGRFVVVERTDLTAILREQKLGATKLVSKETAATLGQLTGAQLLVRGSVTEFEANASGGGLRLGGSFGLLGGILGSSSETAVVGIDLRLVDTTTGEVIKATNATGEAESTALSADITQAFSSGKMNIGGDTFSKTPLGQATREAIAKAIRIIIDQMEKISWTAYVMTYTDGLIYVSAGKEAGIRVGDTFSLYRKTKELKDPSTGIVVGFLKSHIGNITIQDVQSKFSAASFAPSGAGKKVTPLRGDLVQLQK